MGKEPTKLRKKGGKGDKGKGDKGKGDKGKGNKGKGEKGTGAKRICKKTPKKCKKKGGVCINYKDECSELIDEDLCEGASCRCCKDTSTSKPPKCKKVEPNGKCKKKGGKCKDKCKKK